MLIKIDVNFVTERRQVCVKQKHLYHFALYKQMQSFLNIILLQLCSLQLIFLQKQFEALYDFVEYYLSEFSSYSNFTNIDSAAC